MPTLRELGRQMRDQLAPAAAGVTIRARRHPYDTGQSGTATIIDAVVGRTVFASNTTGGPRISFGERDYLIPAASYTLGQNGAVCEPKEGDRFVETIGGQDLCFELRPISGEPAWRYADSGRSLLRLHVKRVTDWIGRNPTGGP